MFQSKATPEAVGRATFLAQKRKNNKVLTFMFFMDDLLKIVSNLSLQFQKDGATCLDFLDSLQAAILDLIQLHQAPGSKLQELLDNIDHRDNKVYYKNTEVKSYAPFDYTSYQGIIDVMIDKVTGRLENPNDPTKAVLQATQIFDTCDWPVDRQQLAVYGTQQVQLLEAHFEQLLDVTRISYSKNGYKSKPILDHIGCDRAQLQQEWVQVKAHLGSYWM